MSASTDGSTGSTADGRSGGLMASRRRPTGAGAASLPWARIILATVATVGGVTSGTFVGAAAGIGSGGVGAPEPSGQSGAAVLLSGGTVWSDGIGFVAGGRVLIRDGKIVAVGADVEAPTGAEVVDLGGFYILPGFVEAHSQTGMHGDGVAWDTDEDVRPLTAELHALDAYYPFAADVEAARRAGITCLLVAPAGKNLVGGTGVIVKPVGTSIDRYVVRQPAALKLSLGEEPKRDAAMPRTRMGQMAMLREHLSRAQSYEQRRLETTESTNGEPFAVDHELDSTAAMLRGQIPALVQVYTAKDIENALRLADEFGFRLILAYAYEAHLMADTLAARQVPVILNSLKGLWYRFEKETFSNDNARVLLEAGVPIALQQGEGNPYGNHDLLFNAGYLLKHGVGEEDALRAITSWPAEILGIDDRVGRLQPGLDADVVVLSGPPFDLRSRVRHVYIDGQAVFHSK